MSKNLKISSNWIFDSSDHHMEFYLPPKLSNPISIAAFDLDWTLIKPKSGRTFPKNKDDWELLYPNHTLEKLTEISKSHQVAIFTNQAGVQIGKTSVSDLKHKFSAIQEHLGFPIIFMASITKESPFRKPATGLWNRMLEIL